jgi:hypothetical protein
MRFTISVTGHIAAEAPGVTVQRGEDVWLHPWRRRGEGPQPLPRQREGASQEAAEGGIRWRPDRPQSFAEPKFGFAVFCILR